MTLNTRLKLESVHVKIKMATKVFRKARTVRRSQNETKKIKGSHDANAISHQLGVSNIFCISRVAFCWKFLHALSKRTLNTGLMF